MKVTPENAVKKRIREVLIKSGCFWYPAVAGPYSVAGIPDYVGCSNGRFFGIEAKAPSKKPTALQLKRKTEIEAAGGKWFIVDGDLAELMEWLS
jgi:hypothetical protein